jgi:RNA polymerase sigma factor (sigma-70 family)
MNGMSTDGRSVTVSPPTEESLAGLVRRAAAGDQTAWDALVARYSPLVWAVARAHRLGPADAADVAQTTWLRLVEHLGRLREPDRLPGWLVTTARRECLQLLNRARREYVGGVPDDVPADADAPVDAGLLADERDAILWRCFRRLSEQCQTILRVLMATPPPSYSDVSVALGIPVGSIGPTRGRCLDRLRETAIAAGLSIGDIRNRVAWRPAS